MKKKLFLVFFSMFLFIFGTFSSLAAEGFEDSDYVYINNVDSPKTVEEIQTELTATDPFDGDLTLEIYVVFDNYTGNESSLGDFIVVYGVTDSGDIETTIAITVRNVDVSPPEFVVVHESLTIHEGSNLSLNLPDITATDIFEGDLTEEIEITGLDLVDPDVIGEYNLIYSVSDSSGNNITQTFVLSVIDGVAPILTGPEEIIKRADYILASDFYLEMYSAYDNVDGTLTSEIEVVGDNYLGNANVPGTYEVILRITDDSGNITSKTLLITVSNSINALMIIDDYDFYVSNQDLFTEAEIIAELKSIGDLSNANYIVEKTKDTYTDTFDSLGLHEFNFNLLSDDGNEYLREIDFHVISSDINLVVEDPSGWDKVGIFISNYWIVGVVIGVIILGIKRK
ncbi:hypothetical protein KQ51_01383 [Candidatus Izimaplasma bacterium HR1]|jgi:hypothetical protein|uniref:immunoglobulin-like domain-containing protein n=1 Tax=Candidatus Izimoplasma sp. HR1 TaxID=1541959 RepID=UPI0004F63FBD|nr:hypothetical protein KQ51_01383 [Candidatus Izimaplasma bacterium HR1]